MTYEEILVRMNEAYSGRSGFEPDEASDIGIRMRVLAKVAGELYRELEELQVQVFPHTAAGEYLDMHAETRGIARKPALAAAGQLQFRRETPAAGDITIPAGVICSTRSEEQVLFQTVEDAVLLAGEQAVSVPAEAVEPGRRGNVAAGAVCVAVSAVNGVTSVVNPAPFSGGADAESDGALRQRLLHSYMNISNGTNAAFYYDLAMGHEGVRSVNVLPRARGTGTVDVVICCDDAGAEEAAASDIQEVLSLEKEINVDVRVYPAVRDICTVTVEIAAEAEADHFIVSENCRGAVAEYIDSLAVGERLLCGQLGRILLGVEGVYNYRLEAPEGDVVPRSDHVVRAGTVTVQRMNTL